MKKSLLSFAASGILSLAAITLFSSGSVFAQGQGQGQGGQQQSPWLRTGNVSSGQVDYLGYQDAAPLIFKTTNTERMKISATGEVSIGVSSTSHKFEVGGGNSKFGGDVLVDGNIGLGTLTPMERLEVVIGNVKFHNDLDVLGKIKIGGPMTPCLECEPPGGGGGGGGVPPKLEVNGGMRAKSLSDQGNVVALANNEGIMYALPLTGSSSQVLLGNGSFGNVPSLDWNISGGNLYMIPGGNVAIGTTSATEKLTVNGGIKIQSLAGAGNAIVKSDNTGKLFSIPLPNTGNQVLLGNGSFGTPPTFDWNVSGTNLLMIPAGNIGIGTTSAIEKLTVQGNTKVSGTLTASCVNTGCVNVSGNLTTAGTISANTFNANKFSSDSLFVTRIMPAVGDSEIHIGDSSIIINGNINSIAAYGKSSLKNILIQGQYPGQLLVGGTNHTLLNLYMGNVGIGNSAPSEKLEVSGNIRINDSYDLLLRNSHHGLGWYGPTSYGGVAKTFAGEGVDGPVLYGYSGGALGVKTSVGGSDVERIALLWDANGNVGIGTNTPQARLQLSVANDNDDAFAIFKAGDANFKIKGNGEAYAREVFIYAQGETIPDYVFGENYTLAGWEKEREHWKKYSHLLGMPSAADVQKSGAIGMKDIQLNTLKKLEELYLYTDELRLYVDKLNKKVELLTEENKQLKAQKSNNKN